jgi:hypothetical protein
LTGIAASCKKTADFGKESAAVGVLAMLAQSSQSKFLSLFENNCLRTAY